MIEFPTVALMKLSKLPTGNFIRTQGYTTAGDGLGAKYLIVAPQSFDGIRDHELADGNIAVLQDQQLLSETMTYNLLSDANYTLTDAQNKQANINITDTVVNLTTARDIIVSDTERLFTVNNNTLQILTFKTASGSGIAIDPGVSNRPLYCDGTDVVEEQQLVAETITHNMASDANYTLTDAENRKANIDITDTSVNLTAARDIIVKNIQREFIASNNTLQTLTFKTSSGTGIDLIAGIDRRKLYCDGTDVIEEQQLIVESITHDMASDADYTLSDAENKKARIIITDTSVNLTTARNIIVSNVERELVATNDTAQSLTFKTTSGSGISIGAGMQIVLFCDGTNVIVGNNYLPIYETEITGAAVSNIPIDGLDINAHRNYRIIVEMINVSAGSLALRAFINNDTTETNYYSQSLLANASTVTAARNNDPSLTSIDVSDQVFVEMTVSRNFTGYATIQATSTAGDPATIKQRNHSIMKTSTVTNITRLDLFSFGGGNDIGIGSRVKVFII
jgi:hypothetical protein